MRLLSPTLCLLLALAGSLAAQVPPGPARASGKVLLLENDRLLEGDIDRVGDQYRVRRGTGELWLPIGRAKRLCKDVTEALTLMQTTANLQDPDDRLRLARWCQLNGLRDQALSEAKAALELRPDHAETLHLVQILQRLTAPPGTNGSGLPPTALPRPAAAPARVPLDVSQDSFALFTARVQPV